MSSAQKLEILLKKSRQNAYKLRSQLTRTETQLAAAELTVLNQNSALTSALAELEELKKENARLKRQSKRRTPTEQEDTDDG